MYQPSMMQGQGFWDKKVSESKFTELQDLQNILILIRFKTSNSVNFKIQLILIRTNEILQHKQ
ncbi:hypothetical protein GGR35_002814 [Mucilaginibacter phyllosphaerae]|uniref:Uncharacterized protein n=1 Tax=Mucilaginibacter phyllosphaerae TaxID=1812349 RepID=A0ABR6IAU4_9SPHI|nr:hypothetical protein [Mucilaginibacter phyllosphaerae]